MTTSSDTGLLTEDLVHRFGLDWEKDDFRREQLTSQCFDMCRIYNLSAEELFWKWEAILYTPTKARSTSASRPIFDATAVSELKASLSREVAQKKGKEQQARRAMAANAMQMMVIRSRLPNNSVTATPSRLDSGLTRKIAGPSVSFKEIGDAESMGKRKYRYMYEKMSERSEVLDERIDEFAELIKQHYQIDELGDPASATQEDIYVVGRICTDADTSSSSGNIKLNETNIYLESSRMMGSGARVLLNFDPQVKLRGTTPGAGLGMFPGAIAAFKGKNGGGGWFGVSEILGLPPLAPPSNTPSSQKARFPMCVACGPFTSDADLDYKPFVSLMERIKADRPAVLLLLGPFIDSSHPRIKTGDVDEIPTDIFQNRIIPPLLSFLEASPNSLVLLVPSVRDIISDHAVYPQCELWHESVKDMRIKFLPNPCRFTINDIYFAATSVDVLFHIRSQEYVKRGQEVESQPLADNSANDLLANGCRHLFQQRSFYPLFPVPTDHSNDVNLDITHSEGLRLDDGDHRSDHAPHVLILPSRLKHFVKSVDSTLTVNPSYLTKGVYASLQVGFGDGLAGGSACEIVKL